MQLQRFIVAGAQALFRGFIIAGTQRFVEFGVVIDFDGTVYRWLVVDVQVQIAT
ncbi:hypothetical protein D3C75_1385710 [compost metagenome]